MHNLNRADVERIVEQVLENLSIDIQHDVDTYTVKLMLASRVISKDTFTIQREH